jgi:hypothetical protein
MARLASLGPCESRHQAARSMVSWAGDRAWSTSAWPAVPWRWRLPCDWTWLRTVDADHPADLHVLLVAGTSHQGPVRSGPRRLAAGSGAEGGGLLRRLRRFRRPLLGCPDRGPRSAVAAARGLFVPGCPWAGCPGPGTGAGSTDPVMATARAGGLGTRPSAVPAHDWTGELADRAAAGFDVLDFLTAIDDGPTMRVACRLRRSADAAAVLLVTTRAQPGTPGWPRRRPAIPVPPGTNGRPGRCSASSSSASADDRPLLLRDEATADPPLKRGHYLAARLERPWPGAAEPEIGADGRRAGNPSRRRQRPLGVPQDRRPG